MRTVLRAARLIDGTGRVLGGHPTVTVEGQRIASVGQQSEEGDAPGSDGEALDFPDGTILPGLIDMHAHVTGSGGDDAMGDAISDSDEIRLLRAAVNVQTAVKSGVTTIRDCGSPNSVIFPLKDAIRRGIVVGPRLVASGAVITIKGGHCYFFGREANGAAEIKEAVRKQVECGADFIKVMATGGLMTKSGHSAMQYTLAELREAVAEAKRAGKRIAFHCLSKEGVRLAAEAMPDTIEHAYFFEGDRIAHDPKIAEMVARRGIYVTVAQAFGYRALRPGFRSVHPDVVEQLRAVRDAIIATYRDMWRLGIPLLSGPDAGWWHVGFDDYPWSLRLMVEEIGLSPKEAIESGTRVAASALGMGDQIGTLEKGKVADVVVVQGNPLEDVKALEDVRLVMVDGRVVHRLHGGQRPLSSRAESRG